MQSTKGDNRMSHHRSCKSTLLLPPLLLVQPFLPRNTKVEEQLQQTAPSSKKSMMQNCTYCFHQRERQNFRLLCHPHSLRRNLHHLPNDDLQDSWQYIWLLYWWHWKSKRLFTSSSAAATSTAWSRQFVQFGIYHLIGLSENTNQILSLLGIVGSEESVCCTRARRPTSTADTMHVIFGAVGIVKVDDKLDIVHI